MQSRAQAVSEVGTRHRAPALCLLLLLPLAACAVPRVRGPFPPAAVWAAGPVRWLLLPEERRELARVRSADALERFVDRFWARRGEGAEEVFSERSAAADRLYGDERPGSLTDRGRALIVLGPPPILRSVRRSVPEWDPRAGSPRTSTPVRVEIWAYPVGELAPALAAALALPADGSVALEFVLRDERVVLIDGVRVLERAARALVVSDPPARR